jgi:TatD DNase family protein
MKLFDTHAHLTCDELWSNADSLIEKMLNFNVYDVMCICTNHQELLRGIELQHRHHHKHILLAGSTGPNEASEERDFFDHIVAAAERGIVHAIGETGLDQYHQKCSLDLQKQLFIRYIKLASAYQLPLIIHCRDAFDETIELLDQFYHSDLLVKGVFHCFTMGKKQAEEIIKRGFIISFSGIITYKSAENLKQVVEAIGSNDYVLETDSPYLNPGKKRSLLNEPANLPLIAYQLALWRRISLEKVAEESYQNAYRLFRKVTL